MALCVCGGWGLVIYHIDLLIPGDLNVRSYYLYKYFLFGP